MLLTLQARIGGTEGKMNEEAANGMKALLAGAANVTSP